MDETLNQLKIKTAVLKDSEKLLTSLLPYMNGEVRKATEDRLVEIREALRICENVLAVQK